MTWKFVIGQNFSLSIVGLVGFLSLSLSLSLSLIQALLIVFFDYGWVLVDLVGFGYGTCLWCFIFYFILMRATVVVW